MSRIIVKNLPKYYTREEFRKLFESQGTVTDAKIMFTKDGINRRFGYIGYKNEADAKKALEYFNNSFIDTCRISVELAKSVSDSADLKTWSKYSQKEKLQETVQLNDVEEKKKEMIRFLEEPDDKLLEFLQVNTSKGSGNRKTWDNDFNQNQKNITETVIPTADEYQDLAQNEQVEEDTDNIKFDDKVSDLDYLKSKMILEPGKVESDQGNIHPSRLQKMNGDQETVLPEPEISMMETVQVTEEKEEENPWSLIGDTGRLFVRNLPFSTTEEELKEYFERFGNLTEIHLPIYKDTKFQKGYAFIQFMMPEHAVDAYAKCHGDIFQGRILDILPGKDKISFEPLENEKDSFQTKKEKQKKKQANQDFNWNSLFMNVYNLSIY
jgi:multiple RNA-binding domain-containing protein 1